MSVFFQISDAIQSLGPMTYIRESGYTYPIIMATHLSSIAVFGGLILMTDLRLLGLALTDMPIADVVNGLRNWKRLGFCIMFTMGFLLGTSEMNKYYSNPYFLLKMFMLVMVAVHAWYFKSKVYDHPEVLDRSPQIPKVAKHAAILSLIIWIALPCLGRWIAYYEPKGQGPTGPTSSIQLHLSSIPL